MTKGQLHNAVVTGFFSLPSPSLAEHNPDAYNNAMADAPAGAGSCAYCGTGIRNHVVVTIDGATYFIGMDCAQKIGGNVGECARERITEQQREKRANAHAEHLAKWRAEQDRLAKVKAERREKFASIIAVLESQRSSFHRSLVEQLEYGTLSWKQADCALKAMFGRRNKKNAAAWDAEYDALTGGDAAQN